MSVWKAELLKRLPGPGEGDLVMCSPSFVLSTNKPEELTRTLCKPSSETGKASVSGSIEVADEVAGSEGKVLMLVAEVAPGYSTRKPRLLRVVSRALEVLMDTK